MKKKFNLQDLDCANCAAKMEEAIKKIDGVNDASVNFMSQKMMVDAADDRFDAIMDEEDVERYLGLSTLAMVPDKEQGTSSGKKNRKKINRKAGRRSLPGGRKK